MKRSVRRACALVLPWLGVACGGGRDAAAQGSSLDAEQLPYASELVSFEPGENAGYGMEELPDVVLGPPKGGGPGKGSLDVVSLGIGGEIVLGFGERELVDGDGPDLIIFENAFWAGGDPSKPFAEPGEVAVSEDGVTWHTFDCDTSEPTGGSAGSGCAGLEPSLVYDTEITTELDPAKTGGDAFDLADLELERAAFVRIRDLSDEGEGTSAGFDLDAIGLINYAER